MVGIEGESGLMGDFGRSPIPVFVDVREVGDDDVWLGAGVVL